MEYYSSIWAPTNSLAHYGVLGMKWGVRRYQNADGSLTAAGRRRYGVDLDITNKSRENIARIRLGEARRRYDTAKENNPTNKTRLAELKGRERSAKNAVRQGRAIDKGANLASKGRTITGTQVSRYLVTGALFTGSKILARTLSSIANSTGKYDTYRLINNIGQVSLAALMAGVNAKGMADERAIRRYYNSSTHGTASIKAIGGEEYKDVVERRKRGD